MKEMKGLKVGEGTLLSHCLRSLVEWKPESAPSLHSGVRLNVSLQT